MVMKKIVREGKFPPESISLKNYFADVFLIKPLEAKQVEAKQVEAIQFYFSMFLHFRVFFIEMKFFYNFLGLSSAYKTI